MTSKKKLRGRSWINIAHSNGIEVQLFDRKYTVWLSCKKETYAECASDADFLVEALNREVLTDERDTEIEKLKAELDEQCKINGMGAQRELQLMATVTEKDAEIVRLKEENTELRKVYNSKCPECGYAGCVRGRKACDSEIDAKDAEILKLREALNVARDAMKYLADTDAWALGKPSASFAHQTLIRIRSILGEKDSDGSIKENLE